MSNLEAVQIRIVNLGLRESVFYVCVFRENDTLKYT